VQENRKKAKRPTALCRRSSRAPARLRFDDAEAHPSPLTTGTLGRVRAARNAARPKNLDRAKLVTADMFSPAALALDSVEGNETSSMKRSRNYSHQLRESRDRGEERRRQAGASDERSAGYHKAHRHSC